MSRVVFQPLRWCNVLVHPISPPNGCIWNHLAGTQAVGVPSASSWLGDGRYIELYMRQRDLACCRRSCGGLRDCGGNQHKHANCNGQNNIYQIKQIDAPD